MKTHFYGFSENHANSWSIIIWLPVQTFNKLSDPRQVSFGIIGVCKSFKTFLIDLEFQKDLISKKEHFTLCREMISIERLCDLIVPSHFKFSLTAEYQNDHWCKKGRHVYDCAWGEAELCRIMPKCWEKRNQLSYILRSNTEMTSFTVLLPKRLKILLGTERTKRDHSISQIIWSDIKKSKDSSDVNCK